MSIRSTMNMRDVNLGFSAQTVFARKSAAELFFNMGQQCVTIFVFCTCALLHAEDTSYGIVTSNDVDRFDELLDEMQVNGQELLSTQLKIAADRCAAERT